MAVSALQEVVRECQRPFFAIWAADYHNSNNNKTLRRIQTCDKLKNEQVDRELYKLFLLVLFFVL